MKKITTAIFIIAYSIVSAQNNDKPFIKFYAVKRVGGDVIVPSALKFAKFSA